MLLTVIFFFKTTHSDPAPKETKKGSDFSTFLEASISSNAFASNASQNSGNFLTERPTTNVLAPPGAKQLEQLKKPIFFQYIFCYLLFSSAYLTYSVILCYSCDFSSFSRWTIDHLSWRISKGPCATRWESEM